MLPRGITGRATLVLLAAVAVVHVGSMLIYELGLDRAGHEGQATHATLLSTTIMVGGVVLVAVLLLRGIVAPLRRMAQAADRIGHTADVAPVAEEGPREVRQVAQALNAMQRRLSKLVSDRTEALAAVSHDLRTPITRLRLRAGFVGDPEVQAAIDRDLDEMEAMVEATLAYFGDAEGAEAPRPTDLPALLETLVDAEVDLGRSASYEGPAHLTVMLRPVSIRRAFGNLIANAVAYGHRARVSVACVGMGVQVRVEDDGPGIPPDAMDRVLEPFVRLEQSRNRATGGVGLGLTIAHRAVEADGGTMRLENRPGGGLAAIVTLPLNTLPRRGQVGSISDAVSVKTPSVGQRDCLADSVGLGGRPDGAHVQEPGM